MVTYPGGLVNSYRVFIFISSLHERSHHTATGYSSLRSSQGDPQKSLDIPWTRRYRPTKGTLYIKYSPRNNTILHKTTPLYRIHANYQKGPLDFLVIVISNVWTSTNHRK
ncbi:uncharacterized protein METZ01_LOCUS208433 [marine metagenome]|uniref:Uncharacterized protein n=1 Tax=marine metagenome TaxID=408172 RepID=A0A382EYS5_9ZZZZ